MGTAKIIAKSKNSRSYNVKTLTNKVYTRNRKHLTLSKGNCNFCSKLNIGLNLDDIDEINSTSNVHDMTYHINDSNVQSNGVCNIIMHIIIIVFCNLTLATIMQIVLEPCTGLNLNKFMLLVT